MVIYGLAPAPFGPGFIQFLLHDCDLNSLTPAFVSEWYPELYRTLQAWIALGPANDDLSPFRSHFASYHDVDVSHSYPLSFDQTSAYVVFRLLHSMAGQPTAIMLLVPRCFTVQLLALFFQHMRKWRRSLRASDWTPTVGFLWCRQVIIFCCGGYPIQNDDQQLRELVHGGTEALLNHLWTSEITSFTNISNLLSFSDTTPATIRLDFALKQVNRDYTIQYLFLRFLQGTGIPSNPHFEDATHHFSGHVDLSHIDKKSFRPRIFCWALTGSPALDFGSSGLHVRVFPL